MALLLTTLYRMYDYTMTELPGNQLKTQKKNIKNKIYIVSDPRVQHLLFLNNVCWPLGIIGGYVYFALYWGPKWMKNKKAFPIERLMDLYNAIQVVYCVYIVVFVTKNLVFFYLHFSKFIYVAGRQTCI